MQVEPYQEESKQAEPRRATKKQAVPKKKQAPAPKKAQKKAIAAYFENEADEDEDDLDSFICDEEEEDVQELPAKVQLGKRARAETTGSREESKIQPKQKRQTLDLDQMQQKYEKFDELERQIRDEGGSVDELLHDEPMIFEKTAEGEIQLRQAMQPSIKDPLLWQAKVQKGKESFAVLQILTKCVAYVNAGKSQGIISAVCFEHIKGSIFIEAYKEQDALEMVMGIRNIISKRLRQIKAAEMPKVAQMDSHKISLPFKKHQWVRVKDGLYKGDLALVEHVTVRKSLLRLVPRIKESSDKQKNKKEFFKPLSKQKMLTRPPPRLMRMDCDLMADCKKSKLSCTDKHYYKWPNDLQFRRGFLFVEVANRLIECDNIKPEKQELIRFQAFQDEGKNAQFASSEDEWDNLLDETLKRTLVHRFHDRLTVGDKVIILQGEAQGMVGSIKSFTHERQQVTVQCKNLNWEVEICLESVCKHFSEGEEVRISSGPREGQIGLVKLVRDDKVIVELQRIEPGRVLAEQQELSGQVWIYANNLQLTADLAKEFLDQSERFKVPFRHRDLVLYDQNSKCGLVVQVYLNYLMVLGEDCRVQQMTFDKVKRFQRNKNAKTIDKFGNTITPTVLVKVVEGKHSGVKARVLTIFRNTLFLQCQTMNETHGYLAVSTGQVRSSGEEHLDRNENAGLGNPRVVGALDKIFQNRDLKGQYVFIQKGEFKGFKAHVLFADDIKYRLEIMAQHKIVTLQAVPGLISEPLKDQSAALGVEQNEEIPASFDEVGQIIQFAEDQSQAVTFDKKSNSMGSSTANNWGQSPGISGMSPALSLVSEPRQTEN